MRSTNRKDTASAPNRFCRSCATTSTDSPGGAASAAASNSPSSRSPPFTATSCRLPHLLPRVCATSHILPILPGQSGVPDRCEHVPPPSGGVLGRSCGRCVGGHGTQRKQHVDCMASDAGTGGCRSGPRWLLDAVPVRPSARFGSQWRGRRPIPKSRRPRVRTKDHYGTSLGSAQVGGRADGSSPRTPRCTGCSSSVA